MENIKEYYTKTFPTDELGADLDYTATFEGLLIVLFTRKDVYDYVGVSDSVIRERLFERLAEIYSIPYNDVYYQWLLDPIN
jgi:hypothetical protein